MELNRQSITTNAGDENIPEFSDERNTLYTRNLVKTYGKRTVANNVSISVRQGEIVGLLGPKERVIGEIPNGTCILVTKEADDWCEVSWNGQTGYCKTEFLILYRGADLSLLDYRVLRDGDKGDDVVALKKRLQELRYIRSGATLTNRYTQETAQRVILFQRQTGMTEDGVAWQELQAYLFSDKALACSQTLPRIRTKVADKSSRMICGCCMGDGCECCNFTGYVYN